MARFNRIKHRSSTAKLVFLTSFAGLLGVALVVHFIWASSSFYVASFYSSVAPIWVLEKSGVVVVTNVTTTKIADKVSTLTNWQVLWIPILSSNSVYVSLDQKKKKKVDKTEVVK